MKLKAALISLYFFSAGCIANPELITDLQTGTPVTGHVEISNNGRFIAFKDKIIDRQKNEQITVPGGKIIASISANANYGAYTYAGNIYLINLITNEEILISKDANGNPAGGSINPKTSADGKFTLFQSNSPKLTTSGSKYENFLYNSDTDSIELLPGFDNSSVITGNGISSSGSILTYGKSSSDTIRIYDTASSETTDLHTQTSGSNPASVISANGRYIVYTRLVQGMYGTEPEDTALLAYDRKKQISYQISARDKYNQERNIIVSLGQINVSGDGRFVVFISKDDSLVANDNNQKSDVFVYDQLEHELRRVNTSEEGEFNFYSAYPSISEDGHYIIFQMSSATITIDGTAYPQYVNYIIENPLFESGNYCNNYTEY